MIEPRSLEELRQALSAGARPTYYFFWGHRASGDGAVGKWCLSQWWPSPFDIAGVTYPTAEHYMMAAKAEMFGDSATRAAILSTDDPVKAKSLGRSVRGFDEPTWVKRRFDLVVEGNVAKFSQHPSLRSFLLSIREEVIVEASPVDSIWGIGLAQTHVDARDPARWRGLNLLGFALMEVRNMLRQRVS